MAWNQNGVTIARYIPDQAATAVNWGATQVRLPTQQIKAAGYLRGLYLSSPATTSAGSVTLGGGTFAVTAQQHLGALRAIQRIIINLQGALNLYDIAGTDLLIQAYTRQGADADLAAVANPAIVGNSGAGTTYPFASINSVSQSSINNWGPSVATNGTTNNTFGFWCYLPISENIRLKTVPTPDGKGIMPTDMSIEMGFLTAQNLQQNIVPQIILNPLFSLGFGSPYQSTGAAVATVPTTVWNLSSNIFDIPDAGGGGANLPPPLLQSYYITRTSQDVSIAGGRVTYTHRNAGFLLRSAYMAFLDGGTAATNDQYVDLGNLLNSQARIQFKYGSAVFKLDMSLQENFGLNTLRYGVIPPGFALIDNMYDGTEIDAPNTGILTTPQTIISGLDTTASGPTRMRIYEERAIPIIAA